MKIAVAGRTKRDADMAIATGWWAERFAREKRLSPLGEYLERDGREVGLDEASRLRSWAKGVDAKFKPH